MMRDQLVAVCPSFPVITSPRLTGRAETGLATALGVIPSNTRTSPSQEPTAVTHHDANPERDDTRPDTNPPDDPDPKPDRESPDQDVDVDEQGEESFPASDPPANY